MGTKENRHELIRDTNNVVHFTTVLKELRAQRVATAIQYLEFILDCQLLIIEKELTAVDASTRSLVVSVLKQVQAYRLQYPRTVEPCLFDSPGLRLTEIEEVASQAVAMLRNVT